MNMNEAYNKRFNAIKNGKPYTFDYKKAVFGTTDSEKIVNLINEPLSSALFRYMEELDVSVNQLALMTGISASSISRYRKGRRGIKRDYLCAICIALGLFSCQQRHLFTITHNVLPDVMPRSITESTSSVISWMAVQMTKDFHLHIVIVY